MRSDLFIVDNSELWKVENYLYEWADLAHTFDVATGYFEIGALLALDGQWQKLDKLRILMGDEVSKRTRAALLAGVATVLDASIEKRKEKDDFLSGVPAIVDALQRNQIECRVFAKKKFHAKAYITHARQEVIGPTALVGSSNFTVPGLTDNVELNVQIRHEVNVLQEWYERHWEEAEDITPEILKVIERHTREYSPFEVYAKALQEYFRGHELPARTKAYLLQIVGILAMAQGDYDHAVALHEEGMTVYRDLGHKKGVSASLRELGFVAYEQGDYERAVRLHEQSLALAREFGTTFGIARSIRALADAVRGQGDLRRATMLLEESLALSRGLENAWGIVRTLASLGSVACEAGEDARASRFYEESLELGWRVGFKHTILPCLEGLARVAAAQGRMERVARLYGTAAALREEVGWPLPPARRAEHDRTVAAARGALGEDAFAAAWARGHALPLEDAITDTLSNGE